MLEELDGATTDAIEFAVERGWVVVQAGHSICLTDAGRRQRAASLIGSTSRAVHRQARALCVELARVTDGQPMQWRMAQTIAKSVGIDEATADARQAVTSASSRALS